MTIIHKYLAKELMRYFLLVLTIVVSIYLTVDFFERIDAFLEAELPLSRAVDFFALKVPFIVAQVMPVGVLLAVLIVFGLMVRNNEMLALQSSGVSIYYLFKPVLIIGLTFSVLLFFLGDVLVPLTTGKANEIWHNEVKGESGVASRKKNIWIKGNRSISHIKYFKPSGETIFGVKPPDATIFGVTLNYFDAGFRLTKRIDAQKGVYTEGKWHLFDVVEQSLLKDDEGYEVTYMTENPVELGFAPADLSRVAKKPEEMSYRELSAYIREVEEEGYDATSYRVDLHAKTAFPFVCVIMSIAGVGLACWRKRKEGLASSIFIGIVIAFTYWTFYSFCLSLGYGDIMPPMIAAWFANGIFVCLGTFVLLNAN